MPPFFCLVHAELHRQCFSGLFYYLFDKSATYRRRILRIYPNLRRPCGSLWVLCRGFFRNQTADFYIFLPAAAAKLSFSHVLILYMLPYGSFPERQRNEKPQTPRSEHSGGTLRRFRGRFASCCPFRSHGFRQRASHSV